VPVYRKLAALLSCIGTLTKWRGQIGGDIRGSECGLGLLIPLQTRLPKSHTNSPGKHIFPVLTPNRFAIIPKDMNKESEEKSDEESVHSAHIPVASVLSFVILEQLSTMLHVDVGDRACACARVGPERVVPPGAPGVGGVVREGVRAHRHDWSPCLVPVPVPNSV
jgi:hypothetical protein